MARNNTGSERFYVSSWGEKVPDFKSTLVLIARNLIINSRLTRQCFYNSLKIIMVNNIFPIIERSPLSHSSQSTIFVNEVEVFSLYLSQVSYG